MRRISRVDRSIDLLRIRTTTHLPLSSLCSACRHRATPFSTSSLRKVRSNTKVPLTEKIRRKIWGTDQPPGLEDPYGDASVFDQTKKRAREKELESRKASTTPADLGSYEPASSWDGLEMVGGFGGWWRDNWDSENQFEGFLPAEVATNTEEITAALHRAMVEVFALQQAGKPMNEVANAVPGVDLTQEVQIIPSTTGATLQYGGDTSLETIVQSLAATALNETGYDSGLREAEENEVVDGSDLDPVNNGVLPRSINESSENEAPTESEGEIAANRNLQDPLKELRSHMTLEEAIAAWDPSWLQISLEDPEIKFAVLKRTMQLTGIRIPDSSIISANTTRALLSHLVTPPKPRKLVDTLAQNEDLITLPNLSVYAKRITPIDKERSVGRWKIIEKELQERGLPVTGN